MLRSGAVRLSTQMSRKGLAALRRGELVSGSIRRMPMATGRRSIFNYGDPVPEHQFKPTEDLLLDATAWFVAFALCYTPSAMESYEYDDDDDDHDHDHDGGTESRNCKRNGGTSRRKDDGEH